MFVLSTPGTNGSVPAYWKNGVPVKLASPNKNGVANAIAVSGSDVYVAGDAHSGSSGSFFATCWKNGVATTLPGNGNANAIAVVAPQ